MLPPNVDIVNVVPDTDQHTVDVRIRPRDIDQASIGSAATLRFSAQTTPQLHGTVAWVSSERSADQRQTPRPDDNYYLARVRIDQKELQRLSDLKLRNNMPVDAYVRTASRTLLSSILEPLRDQISRAFSDK